MSIAEKLTTIAENERKVFETGKKAEQDYFWEIFQNSGKRTNYAYAFYDCWNDETFNPKYPIDVGTGTNNTTYAFTYSEITDTKVEIIAKKTTATMFYNSKVRIIRKLTVAETTEFPNNTFYGATELEELTMSGTIAKAFKVSDTTKLSKASIKSVFSCLSDTTTELTTTFSKTAVNKAFETSEGANDGSTSAEWNTLVATKPNWTISLV